MENVLKGFIIYDKMKLTAKQDYKEKNPAINWKGFNR